ncbi:hypothetical protein BYT27DRAFT_7253591 [Phlegmacium glaucopus]|nr:hypothetical protein BYT27DRAFT_7253591 [Phlegmacium glaucopus]
MGPRHIVQPEPSPNIVSVPDASQDPGIVSEPPSNLSTVSQGPGKVLAQVLQSGDVPRPQHFIGSLLQFCFSSETSQDPVTIVAQSPPIDLWTRGIPGPWEQPSGKLYSQEMSQDPSALSGKSPPPILVQPGDTPWRPSDQAHHPVGKLSPVHSALLDSIDSDNLHQDVWKHLADRIRSSSTLNYLETTPCLPCIPSEDPPINSLSRLETPPSCLDADPELYYPVVMPSGEALMNPLYIPWDVEQYHVERVKGRSLSNFPNPAFGQRDKPLTVVDAKGRIILWYLPGLLSNQQQASFRQATVIIAPLLRASIKSRHPGKTPPSWRIDRKQFTATGEQRTLEPGAVTFSAGWFAQGHTGDKFSIKPSANLKSNQVNLGGSNWMKESTLVEHFLNLTLSLIHPQLFKTGLLMLRKIRMLPTTREIAQDWPSVYTGIQTISNCLTPGHRDSKG